MSKNAVVTWASGTEFCQSAGFKTYVESLSAITDSDFYVLTHDMPESVVSFLEDRNIVVEKVDPKNVHFILRDRHLAFYEWINKKENEYDLFLFTDSKDVKFQSNPFDLWNGKPIMLVCEGMEHKQSLWNLNDQSQVQVDAREFKFAIQDEPVLNGGIIMGKGSCLKNHFFVIWSSTLKSLGRCTDQGVLNYLFHWLRNNSDYSFTDPRHDTFCLTGEAVKEEWIRVLYEDGVYKNLQGEPYSIVHQWDRIKGL